MKKTIIVLLALVMALSLAACGGSDTSSNGEKPSGGIADIDGGGKGNESDGEAGTSSLSWPSADFITPGMEYTGGGTITYVDYIDGSTQEGGGSQYGVYINGATLDDAKAYIDTLKTDGFDYYSTVGDSEPEAAFEFGYFNWMGEADGGKRFVTIYVGEEVDTYGMSGAEYTMSILMMDQNIYK